MRRSFLRLTRFHFSTSLKCFSIFFFIYLVNFLTGLQDYFWLEKSFENEYHLTMTTIDLSQINEENAETILGPPKYFLSNKFLIKNEYFCSNNRTQSPRVLILVKSAIENQQARQAIRLTWANQQILKNHSIQVAFVLGISEKNFTIEHESQQYQDLIQIDKLDTYYHNSYKMSMMLRWITEYCSSKSSLISSDYRQYVLFIDDDYYLNMNSLINYLNQIDYNSDLTLNQRRTFLTGYVYNHSRPRRFLNDRWYISIDDYPYDRYPPYVTAGCFLMTRSNVRLFNLASKYVRLFRFDDIYMGLLAYSMSIKLIPNNHLFSSYNFQTFWSKFFVSRKLSDQSICLHGYRDRQLIEFWNELHQTNLTIS